jgi:hypothetical protein
VSRVRRNPSASGPTARGRAGEPPAVGQERPLVDVLHDELVMREPGPRALDAAVDASGEHDRARVDQVPAAHLEVHEARHQFIHGSRIGHPVGVPIDDLGNSGQSTSEQHIAHKRSVGSAPIPGYPSDLGCS